MNTWPGHAFQLFSCTSSDTHNTFHALLFFKISVNTFSCSWPEDKYGNWIPKWDTWLLLWQLSIRLNLYNMFKLLPKFRINMLLIYRDRPPPSFSSCSLRALIDPVLNIPFPYQVCKHREDGIEIVTKQLVYEQKNGSARACWYISWTLIGRLRREPS